MYRLVLQLPHHGAELAEILVGGILEVDRDMDVRHAEPADARGLVGQRLFVGMKAEVDDMADAEGADFCQLGLGRLAGGGDPVVEPTPVVDRIGVGYRGSACFSWPGRLEPL